jgi:tetratricopeptide (TPR) repeat protein
MTLASTRSLAASLVALLVLAPVQAVASPYAVLAPPSAGGPAPASKGSDASVSPTVAPGAASAPTDSAATAAATAPVEPLSDDPALEYRRGEQAYALGNYEQAVRHFEHSYELSNFADLLYNLGMAYAQWHGLDGDVGHLRKAKRLFQNYTKRLAENPQMDQSQRDEAEAQIARIDEQIAEHEKRVAAPPPIVKPEPQPQPQPLPDQPEKKPVYKRGWFWGVIGVVVVAAAVTTAVVVLTRKPGFEPELGNIGPNSSTALLRF